MRIAYFTNQYPAVSHTFIRREIHALETLGVTVIRYAIRPPPQTLVDSADKAEHQKTRHIVQAGLGQVLRYFVLTLVKQPLAVISLFYVAAKMGWRSDRGIVRHFAYVVEATLLSAWCRHDGIEHLHAHFGTNPAAVAMFASKLSGIPYSFTAHGSEEFEKAPLLSLDVKVGTGLFRNLRERIRQESAHAVVLARPVAQDRGGALWGG